MSRKSAPIIIANWKMNGLLLESMRTFKQIRQNIHNNLIGCEVVICPPFTLLRDMAEKTPGTGVKLGGQNCHSDDFGSYTGEISAKMLYDMTCSYVIVGHSERRSHFNESSEFIARKAAAAHRASLVSIICVGETDEQRKAGEAKKIVKEQIINSIPECSNSENTVIAYEPVWSIGTNIVPTAAEIEEMHQYITKIVADELKQFENGVKVVYGGSANEKNAKEILAIEGVGGLLVGRASLSVDSFWQIIEAAS